MASHGKDRSWEIVYTRQVRGWLGTLTEKDRVRIGTAIQQLRLDGPALDSTRAKLILSSRHHNMKELRSVGGHMRILFAFDPGQRAVLLAGGDKSGDWDRWYKRHVPFADRSYDKHLRSLGKESPWAASAKRARERPPAAGR